MQVKSSQSFRIWGIK